MLELRQAFDILDIPAADGPVLPATAEPDSAAQPIGIGLAESPRGATSCIIECDEDTVRRVRLRTGSYANWRAVAQPPTITKYRGSAPSDLAGI